ncbi:uncharacterized protein A4U43_C01F8640 [Asparagus officinalis]|uniref:Uncharacterized protein n=1 Tax=Asparagus officinalis TaxID=4686 RepID=A0A5P1FPL4_ASPOF|nr:uncharacterized protein A4U43_C01F8640 [Asparagus officinalis]
MRKVILGSSDSQEEVVVEIGVEEVRFKMNNNSAGEQCQSSKVQDEQSIMFVQVPAQINHAYFIGRFVTGLPPFSKKKYAENKWTLHKDGLLGRQVTHDYCLVPGMKQHKLEVGLLTISP